MSEAASSITRRALLGHASGACVALTVLPSAAATPALAHLISRHRVAELAWLDLDAAFGDLQSAKQKAQVTSAYLRQSALLDDLLAFRPVTIEEARERVVYLLEGPWCGSIPSEGEITALLHSFLPEAVS